MPVDPDLRIGGSIVPDKIDGLVYSETRDGRILTRRMIVKVTSGNANYERVILAAKSQGTLEVGIGDIGDKLSTERGVFELASKTCEPISNSPTKFLITEVFEFIGEKKKDSTGTDTVITSLTFGGSLIDASSINARRVDTIPGDSNGLELDKPITVQFKNDSGDINIQNVQVKFQKPTFVMSLGIDINKNPIEMAPIDGAVNKDTFQGFSDDTMLCTRAEAVRAEGAPVDLNRSQSVSKFEKIKRWSYKLDFQLNLDTWTKRVFHIDPATKLPTVTKQDQSFADVGQYLFIDFDKHLGFRGISLFGSSTIADALKTANSA